MDGIKGLKIRKSTFQFGIKHRYSPELKFRKVEKTLGEKLLGSLKSMRKPKEKVVLEGAGPDSAEAPKKESKPLLSPRTAGRIGGGAILFILLLAAGILYFQSMVNLTGQALNPSSGVSLSPHISASDLLTASEEGQWRQPFHTAFLRLETQAQGIEGLPVEVSVYNRVIPSSIYVLRSHRYQAENYAVFISTLKNNLSKWGISINDVGIGELSSLPSQSLIIVPSGYIPEEMLSRRGSRITDLLQRGATILYMGQPFNRMYSESGAVVTGTPSMLAPLFVQFDSGEPLATSPGFNLKSPLYAAGDSRVMGSGSVVYYGDGAILFLPQTLDGGWPSGELAAEDVQSLILNVPWFSPIGSDSEDIVFENGSAKTEFFTTNFRGDSMYVQVKGYDNASGYGFLEVAYLEKATRGEIYTSGHSVPPSALGPTQMDVVVELKESGGEERLFLSITQFGREIDRQSIATSELPLNSDATFSHLFSLDPGDYIMNVVDSNGRSYARSYMRAGDITVVQSFANFQNDIYEFQFFADGVPISLTGDIYVDGHGTPVHFEEAESVLVEASVVAGGPLAADADHIFTLEVGEYETSVTMRKAGGSSIFTDPLILGAIGIAVLALGAGFIFARKGVSMYGLDIPDFPPQSTTKIPMGKEKLIGILEKVNKKYRWSNTPLKLGEVKIGFKDMLHEGKPIFISDYNLEYILSRLMGMGLLKRELGYYGVSSWEGATGHNIRYLASFRRLRDICINNAVPFTQMGKGKDYDSKITVLGQDIFVHLYDLPDRAIPNSLASLQRGMNIIVFEEEAEKSEFYEYLSGGSQGATALKLEIQAGSILMKTWDEFSEMIKEMKV